MTKMMWIIGRKELTQSERASYMEYLSIIFHPNATPIINIQKKLSTKVCSTKEKKRQKLRGRERVRHTHQGTAAPQ